MLFPQSKSLGGLSRKLGVSNVVSYSRAVELTGYSVPHPSKRNVNLRVQTKPNADINAIGVFKQGIEDLSAIREHIKTTFELEFDSLMMDDE